MDDMHMKARKQGGSTRIALVVALVAAVGVMGFWLGRRGQQSVAPDRLPAGSVDMSASSPAVVESCCRSNTADRAPATPPSVVATDVAAAVRSDPVTNAPVDPPSAVVTDVRLANTQAVAQAEAALAAGRRVEAREAFRAALDSTLPAPLRGALEAKLGQLNVELVRQPWAIPEKTNYVVAAGDAIKAIAQKHGTTVDLIVESNGLKRPDHIEPGDRLSVFSGGLAVLVSKTRNDLLVTSAGRFFKRYQVGTGKFGKTPVGTFVISERIKDPPWWRNDGKVIPFGDKENILGTRWMALKATGNTPEIKGYGIHGTWEPDSIGKAESAGCIRLRNADVEELFLLLPVGTPVSIEE